MNKSEMVSAIAERTKLTKIDVAKVLDAMQFVIIEECVSKGGEVNLPQLGKFKRKVNKARKGVVSPLTKQVMDIPETHTLSFKPNSAIKKKIV